MSTIVISILPKLGHINSPLKLAKSLMARGHDVYILGGGADYKPYIQKEGLRYITLGETVGNDVFNTRPLMRAWLEGRLLVAHWTNASRAWWKSSGVRLTISFETSGRTSS